MSHIIKDPEEEFTLSLTVEVPGFGKQKDQNDLAENVLRLLETKLGKERGVRVYQRHSWAEYPTQVHRTDRNAPER